MRILAGLMCFVMLFVCPQALWCEEAEAEQELPPFITDRPDITESSQVVWRGILQVETSAYFQFFENSIQEENFLATPTLLRIGLGGNLEFRFSTGGFTWEKIDIKGGDESKFNGYSPIWLGAKYEIGQFGDSQLSPHLGTILQVRIPSGSEEFKKDELSGRFLLAAAWDISDRWGYSMNGWVNIDELPESGVNGSGGLSGSAGYAVKEKIGAFFEFTVGNINLRDDPSLFIFDTGMTFLMTPNSQFDFALGAGLTEDTVPDFFATIGLSFRAPLFGDTSLSRTKESS